MKNDNSKMLITKIFSIVLGLHLFIISTLLIVPGCVTTEVETDSVDADLNSMKEDTIKPEAISRTERKRLDPVFNAGFEARSSNRYSPRSGRYPPTRPTPKSDMDDIIEPLGDLIDTSYANYTVQAGDSPWAIANAHGVDLDDLLAANGFARQTTIYVGQEIVIPESDNSQSSSDVDFSSIDAENEYIVQPGDTLSTIAFRRDVTVKSIIDANKLSSDLIYVGQVLYIPQSDGLSKDSISISKDRLRDHTALGSENIHIVEEGETPNLIARIHDMKTEDLLRLNNISDPTKLQIGQALTILKSDSTVKSTTPPPSIIRTDEEMEQDLFEIPESEESQLSGVENLERSLLDEEEKIPVIPIDSENDF